MKIIDISRSLTPDLAVWPGDEPFCSIWNARIEEGDTVNLSTVRMSVHAGTHADAPLHFKAGGASIDEIPLLQFIGPCLLIDINDHDVILPDHVAFNDDMKMPRLLFKTRHSRVADTRWEAEMAPFLPETIDRMGSQGVVLIGTDAPSVDPVDSQTLDAHHALARLGIVNIENLVLKDVAPGPYRLVALPLKVIGLDAAPVRAVLLEA